MSEEEKETKIDETNTTETTTNIEEKVKVVFKDKIEIRDTAISISGSCQRCGERFQSLKAVNGKITCPKCNFEI